MAAGQRTPQDERLLANLRAARRDPDPITMAFLERLQRETQDGLRRKVTLPDEATAARISPTVAKEDVAAATVFLREALSAVREPTPYESPGVHVMLQMLAVRIDEQVAAHGRWPTPKRPPVFGLLGRGQVSALTVRVPGNGDHLVLVDEELFTFLHVFAKAVAFALPPVPVGLLIQDPAGKALGEHVRQHLRSSPEAVDRFSDAVLAFTIAGRASAAASHFLPPELANYANALRDASELFVVAHEYAHVLEGHLNQALPNMAGEEDGVVRQSMLSMAHEGIADMLGLELTTRALAGGDPRLGLWGLDFFLSCNEILMKALGILRTGSERGMHDGEAYQHASFDARRMAMNYFFEKVPGRHMVREMVTELWQRTRPLVEAAHRRGLRPSPTWDA